MRPFVPCPAIVRLAAAAAAGAALAAFAPAPAAAQGFRLEASVNPARAVVGETVVYVLRVAYDAEQPPEIAPPRFDPAWGFSPMPGNYSSQTMTVTNGRMETVLERRTPFAATKDGTYVIPPSGFSAGGRTWQSNPVTLVVGKAPPPNAPVVVPAEFKDAVADVYMPDNPTLGAKLKGTVLVVPVSKPGSFYEGQQGRVSYFLYLDLQALKAAGVRDVRYLPQENNAERIPRFRDFRREEIEIVAPEMFTQRMTSKLVDGRQYSAALLYEAVVSPLKAGTAEVPPMKVPVLFTLTAGADGRGRYPAGFGGMPDPFAGMADPFGDGSAGLFDPFQRVPRVGAIVTGKPLPVEVKKLPAEGRPDGFDGVVGSFRMKATLDKGAALAGEDIVELALTLEGKGDAAAITPPKLPPLDGLDLVEPPAAVTENRPAADGATLLTTKKLTYKLRPVKTGALRVPPIELAMFDPETARYRVERTEPLEVQSVASGRAKATVAGAATAAAVTPVPMVTLVNPTPAPTGTPPAAAPTPPTTATATAATTDPSATPATGAPTFAVPVAPPSAGGPGVWAAALAAAAAVAAAAWWAARRRASGPGIGVPPSVAADRLRRALAPAEAALAATPPDPAAACAAVERATRAWLADRHGLTDPAATVEAITETLAEHGAPAETIADTAAILELCGAARYAADPPAAREARARDAITRATALPETESIGQ